MKIIRRITAILLVTIVAGCATSMRVATDYDVSIDFAAYRSFDWLTPPSGVLDPLSNHKPMALMIKHAVEEELIAKGYEKVDVDPDFLVIYHAAAEERINRAYIDLWGYHYPRFRGPRIGYGGVFVSTYEVGTLVVDIIDAASAELVWRGTAKNVVSIDADRARASIETAVVKILAEFPPPGGDYLAVQ